MPPSTGNRATPAETEIDRTGPGGERGDPGEDALGDGRARCAREPRGRTRRHRPGPRCRRAGPTRRGRPRRPAARRRRPRDRRPRSSAVSPSTSKIASDTSPPCRPARASSSSRIRANVRSLASPVSGSVWARRSNHSERSATIEPSRARSIAIAINAAKAPRVIRSSSAGSPSPARARLSTPTSCSIPPRVSTSGRWTSPSPIRAIRSTAVAATGPSAFTAFVEHGARRRVVAGRHRHLELGPVGVLKGHGRE